MKKTLILGLALLLAGCACHNGCCKNPLRNGTCGCRTARCQQKNEAAEIPLVKETPKPATPMTPIMYEGKVDLPKPTPVIHNETKVVGCDEAANVSEAPKVQTAVVPVVQEVEVPAAQTVEVPVVQEEVVPVAAFSCAQVGTCKTQEPVVLKPRVTEVVGEKKRPCCDDDAMLLEDENAETYVPDAPEIYVIAANRTITLMQDEAAPLFKQIGKMKLYVGEATPKAEDLPGGMDKGMETIKKRMEQTENVTVVNNKYTADYRIDSSANWYDTPTKTVPAIKYDITLKDRGGNLIGEWSEIIHQADGDRSWW